MISEKKKKTRPHGAGACKIWGLRWLCTETGLGGLASVTQAQTMTVLNFIRLSHTPKWLIWIACKLRPPGRLPPSPSLALLLRQYGFKNWIRLMTFKYRVQAGGVDTRRRLFRSPVLIIPSRNAFPVGKSLGKYWSFWDARWLIFNWIP